MTTADVTNHGKHILAEFWQCGCEPLLINNTEPLLTTLKTAVKEVGLTLVGESFHQFTYTNEQTQNTGVTISLLLAESHLCVHTWGELSSVTLDIYVCNFKEDNSVKADQLLAVCEQLFLPKKKNIQAIKRTHVSS